MSKRWIVEPGNECNPTETNPMAMQNVVLTFVIIGMAFVVSLIILIIELLVSCCTSRYLLQYILRFVCSFYIRLDAIVRFITITTIFIFKPKRQTCRFQKGTKKIGQQNHKWSSSSIKCVSSGVPILQSIYKQKGIDWSIWSIIWKTKTISISSGIRRGV